MLVEGMMARDKSRLERADKADLPPEEAGKLAARASLRKLMKEHKPKMLEMWEAAARKNSPPLRSAAMVNATVMLAEAHRIMESSKMAILEEGTPQMLRSALEIVKKLVMAGMYQGWNLEVGVQLNRILAELGLRIPTEPCPKHRPGRRVSLPQSAARKRRRR
jgi:hypothetical protein